MGEGWRDRGVASRKAGDSAAVTKPREGPLLNVLHALAELLTSAPDTAEGWVVRLDRPHVGPWDRWRFGRWLAGAPDRLEAYGDARARLRLADSLADDFRMERAGVLARTAPTRRTAALTGPLLAGLATAALVGAVGLWAALEARPPQRLYETGRGELLEVGLEDGTLLALDTDSRLEAVIGDDARQVVLVGGEAWLQVARDPSRPFVARLGDRQVVVTGTRFLLRRRDGRSEVHLVEGAVRLRKAGAATLELRPGDVATYADGGPVSILRRSGDPAPWRSKVLVFEGRRASEVLAAASRYADVTLGLPRGARDPVVTAAVPIGEPAAVTAQLRALFPEAITVD
jgi:transmembrane sensor